MLRISVFNILALGLHHKIHRTTRGSLDLLLKNTLYGVNVNASFLLFLQWYVPDKLPGFGAL